jgi:hypothetical protein
LPWLLWELGVAQALGLELQLLVSTDIHTDSWLRLGMEQQIAKFQQGNFEEQLDTVMRALAHAVPGDIDENKQIRMGPRSKDTP